MNGINLLMGYAHECQSSKGLYEKTVYSRAAHVACAPFDLTISFHNLLKLPLQIIGMPIKGCCVVLTYFTRSDDAKKFGDKLTGPVVLLKTMLKVIAYALNVVFSVTLGIISPCVNERVRNWLDNLGNLSFKSELKVRPISSTM